MTTDTSYRFGDTLLTIDGITMSYGDKVILNNVNAQVKDIIRPGMNQGQVIGLLGPSGRGKTQLSRILAGLQRPTKGRVLVTDKQKPVQQGIMGMVMQHYPLLDHYTVLDNLIVAGRAAGLSKKAASEKGMGFLSRFGLADHGEDFPATLSGGQRQRVAIAQQLLSSDNFLIMDEPFSGLDPVMLEKVCALIQEIAGMNELMTLIVITHDIEAAVHVADHLWMLGWEPDTKGSAIRQTYDLIERGLAWHPELRHTPEFRECVREVSERFRTL